MTNHLPHDDEQDDQDPCVAIRRHHDRCFHAVEEVVPGGYIVEGIMIADDEVAEVRNTSGPGTQGLPACRPPVK